MGTGVAGDSAGGGGWLVLADLVAGGVSVEMVLEVAVETVLRVEELGPSSDGWEVLDLRGAVVRLDV